MKVDTEVIEFIREKSDIIEMPVDPKSFKGNPNIWEVCDMNKRKKQNLVLAVLNYQNILSDVKEKFKALDEQWKLPIAATSYWYRNLKIDDLRPPTKKCVMKSLLLSFLSDSKCYKESRIILITRRTKPDHLRSLHAFAQWQCVYIDAMALNHLAQDYKSLFPLLWKGGHVLLLIT